MITCLALAHIQAEHITCIHARGGWGGWGGWGGMITCLALAHIQAEHTTCIHARGGWGGWGGMITCLALAHILAEHITCIHARGGWGGWGGWGGMIMCLALAHIQAEHTTCIHARGGWAGWGGWDDTVQRLVSKVKILPHLPETVYFPFLYAPSFSTFFRLFPLHFCTPEVWGIIFNGSPIHGKKQPFHGKNIHSTEINRGSTVCPRFRWDVST